MVNLSLTRTENVLRPEFYFISSICTRPLYKNRRFLHENYIEKGLSLRQIAALTMSSKTTIKKALASFDIPIREKGSCYNNPTYPKFGDKKIDGKLLPNEKEQKILSLIINMHEEGKSFYYIAKTLNQMKILNKKKGQKWYRETVRNILMRERIIIER